MSISYKITMDPSGYIDEVKKVLNSNDNMITSVQKVKSTIEELGKMKMGYTISMQTEEANKQISKFQENLNKIKKSVAIGIGVKDNTVSSLSKIKATAEEVAKKNYSLEIKAIDKTKSVINGIKNSIFNLKTLAAGIILGASGKELYDWTLGAAAANEQQLATMQVMMKSKQAGSDMMGWSYREAQQTSFKTSDIVNGVAQLVTNSLDPKKYLMPLLDLSASHNNFPLENIVHDLSLVKNGMSGRGLEELESVGVGRQDLIKAGMQFDKQGQLTNMKGDQAVETVRDVINSKFGNLTQEHAGTAQGLMNRGADYIEQMGRGLAGIDNNGGIMKNGLFDNFKKQLQIIDPLLEKVQKSRAFSELQKQIGNLATVGGQKLSTFLKSLVNPQKINEYKNAFVDFISGIKAGVSVIGSFGSAFVAVGKIILPFIKEIAAHPGIFLGLFAGFESIKGIVTVFETLKKARENIDILTTGFTVLRDAITKSTLVTKIATGVQWLFNAAMDANPIVLLIAALASLYVAYKTNFAGIKDLLDPAAKAIEDKFAQLKKTCENKLSIAAKDIEAWWQDTKKKIESNPIVITTKQKIEQTVVTTKQKINQTVTAAKNTMQQGSKYADNKLQPIGKWINKEGSDIWKGIEGGNIQAVVLKKLTTVKTVIANWCEQQNKENIRQFSKWGDSISKWFDTEKKDIPQHLEKWGLGITNWFNTEKNNITHNFEKWGQAIASWFNKEKNAIPQQFSKWGQSIAKWYDTEKKNIPKRLSQWGTSIATGFKNLGSSVVKGISNWKTSISTGFTNLKKNTLATLNTWKNDIVNWFKSLGKSSVNQFTSSASQSLTSSKPTQMDKIGKVLADILKYTLALIAIAAVALVRELIKEFLQALANIGPQLKKAGNEFLDWFKKGVDEKVADLKKDWDDTVGYFINHPVKATMDIVQKITGKGSTGNNALGTNYWQGGPTWVGENGPELLSLPGGSKILSNRQSNNMVNQLNMQTPKMNTQQTANPLKSMASNTIKWGQDIPDNLAKGITSNTKTVTKSVTEMAAKIRELIHFTSPDKGPLADFDTYPVDMMKTFGSGIKNNTKLVTKPTTDMSTGIQNIYGDLTTKSGINSLQAMQEFGKGIQDSTSNIVSIVKTLTDKVINQFKTSFGIHSPSVVMYKMGNYLMQGLVNGMTSNDIQGFIQNWLGSVMNGVGGNVKGWLSAAIMLTGAPMSWLPALYQIAMGESGGDPLSINLWDSNAAAGHPSKGLMQLIDENMSDWHLPGLDNIWNPVANAAAAIRLIQHQYGSPYNTPGIRSEMSGGAYKGYAVGLTRVPYDNFPAYLHEDERVLTANEARNYNKKEKASIIIKKIADKVIIRSDDDIDKLATALAKKLELTASNC